MNTKTQRTIEGNFSGRELGAGTWQLTAGTSGSGEIYILGAEPSAADLLRGASLRAVSIAWQSGGATLTLVRPDGPRNLNSRTAIIHEPLARLYDGLPLVRLDDRARRFWRRVFRLVRIPGGRYLLGLIARRTGGPR
jgi:hypothetical protein